MRLDKFLADMNVGTRKEVKTAIRKKRVTVNGEIIRDAALNVTGDEDVRVDGEQILYRPYEYYMMNKPAGVLSTTEDRHRTTVIDLMDARRRKDLFPVGRLDLDTEGLLLITNDGELAHRLLAPKFHVDKTYYAEIEGNVTQEDVRAFAKGLQYDTDLVASPADLELLPSMEETNVHTRVRVTIREGKFHQIKKMFEAVGKRVLYLKRISMGPLILDDSLEPGEYRPLTEEEMEALRNTAGK